MVNLPIVVADYSSNGIEGLRLDVRRSLGDSAMIDETFIEVTPEVRRLNAGQNVEIDNIFLFDTLIDKVSDNKYGLILMDDFVPRVAKDFSLTQMMEGVNTVVEMRKYGNNIPIIMLGYDCKGIEKVALEAGVDAYFNRSTIDRSIYMDTIREFYQKGCLSDVSPSR